MTYTIRNRNGDTLATITDGTADTTTLPLRLYGKNYLGYGEGLQNNLVNLLENYSGNTAPSNAVKGQLWYDTNSGNLDLKVYNGSSWVYAVKTAGNLTAGNISVTSNLDVANISFTSSISGSQYVSTVATGTPPLSVQSTTQVPNLNAATAGNLANGTSNVVVNPSSYVTISVNGTANVVNVATDGVTITGNANITANANLGNLGTATAIITTANITTINSGLLQNTTSNVTITAGGNVSTFIGGNATAQLVVTSSGANIAGNANIGNISTATAIITTGNITTINSGVMQNGNSNVSITANSNVKVNVTSANSYTFATTAFHPSANAAMQLGLTGSRWSNVWGVSSSALYADLAEKYRSDAEYEPGTVLELGGEHEITVCNGIRSDRVFGCVSTDPAYLMNDSEKEGIWLPVVLTGRAPIRVVGTVSKGDRLVSAGNGAAMSAGIAGSSYQIEIGRALQDKDSTDVGLIEAYISTK